MTDIFGTITIQNRIDALEPDEKDFLSSTDVDEMTEEQIGLLSDNAKDLLIQVDEEGKPPKEKPTFIEDVLSGFTDRFLEGQKVAGEALVDPSTAKGPERDPRQSQSAAGLFFDDLLKLSEEELERDNRIGKFLFGTAIMTESVGAGLSEALVPDETPNREMVRIGAEILAPFGLSKMFRAMKKGPDASDVLGELSLSESQMIGKMRKAELSEENIVEMIQLRRQLDDEMKAIDDDLGFVDSVEEMSDEDLIKYIKAGQQMEDSLGLRKAGNTPFEDAMGFKALPEGATSGKRGLQDEAASIRNAGLTSSLSNMTRNAETTVGFFAIQSIDEMLQGIIRAATGKNPISEAELGASLSYLRDTLASVGKIDDLNDVFRFHSDTIADMMVIKKRTFENAPITGPARKMAAVASILNNLQEYFFRRIAFEASLRNSLRARGKKFGQVHPSEITIAELEKARDHAFRMTFALGPIKAGNRSLEAITETGFFKLWVLPFPRFIFRNAIPFMFEHSPLGYLQAMSPKVLNKLAKGDNAEFAKAASRSMLGSLFLGLAVSIRSGDGATIPAPGSGTSRLKYYQYPFKTEDGSFTVIDLRPFSPFFAPYLFAAEAMLHPENLRIADIPEMFLGLNRLSATGLALVDSMVSGVTAQSSDAMAAAVGKSIGTFAASFVPKIVDSLTDVATGVIPSQTEGLQDYRSDAILLTGNSLRDAQSQFYQSFLRNMPFYRTKLPRMFDAIDPEFGKVQKLKGMTNNFYKQVTGAKIDRIHPVHSEMKKLGLPNKFGSSRTGVKPFDNLVNREMAILVNEKGGLLDQMKDPKYRGKQLFEKRVMVRNFFSDPKKGAAWKARLKVMTMLVDKGFQEGNIEAQKTFFQVVDRMAFQGKTDLRAGVNEAQSKPLSTGPGQTLNLFEQLGGN